ncbi:hypothetical protein Daus18300_003586 [Diaporthe australafricana]|uniref:Uncharacterized protein n=1 Tax=Diaporthe australafricana TaxID=127596 RepID=A0ABR3XET3_9PEZI
MLHQDQRREEVMANTGFPLMRLSPDTRLKIYRYAFAGSKATFEPYNIVGPPPVEFWRYLPLKYKYNGSPTIYKEARVTYWNETVLYNNDNLQSATLVQALPKFIKTHIRHIKNVNPWRATALGLSCRFDDFECLQSIVVNRPGIPAIQMEWSGALDDKLDATVRKQVLEAPWAEETRDAVDRPAQTAALQKVSVKIRVTSTLGSEIKLRVCFVNHTTSKVFVANGNKHRDERDDDEGFDIARGDSDDE